MRPFLVALCVLVGVQAVQANRSIARSSNPTRMNIVLLTFDDADRMPHGYTRSGSGATSVLTPGAGSYTMDDFKRKFGATGSFKNTVIVGGGSKGGREELPKSYGSLRDYFREISAGSLDFQVRIVNREDPNHAGYPEWIIMGETWGHYRLERMPILLPAALRRCECLHRRALLG